MEQGRLDKRLLERLGKVASAGWLPALAAVAVLAVSGCGGDSSDSGSVSTASSTAASTGESKDDSPESISEPAAGSPGHRSEVGSTGGKSSGEKRGPRIVVPEGEPEPGITPRQRREATVASMTLQSPAIVATSAGPGALPATYTCDGAGSWPALRWEGVPSGTAELALFVMNLHPVEGKLFFDWAVAGLDPGLEGIEAGKLPTGSIVGRNGFGRTGYSICPTGAGEFYVFTLYALPKRLSPQGGFDPTELRKAAIEEAGNVGILAASYMRG
jgi:phosphatidylethanolamine-binding protein (PEBP) family uncharacterized protein